MKKKLALSLAAAACVAAALVPAASQTTSVRAACVEVNGPHGLHLQVGYAPHGSSDCRQLP